MAAVPVVSSHWFSERHLRADALRTRILPPAIRVPARVGGQVLAFPSGSPRLYVHEGARQALERRFAVYHPGPVAVSVTDNRHAMISHSKWRGVLRIRVHHMFLASPARIQEALARYVVRGDREASLEVGRYIERNSHRLARRSPRSIPLDTEGRVHNVLAIAEDVSAKYFDGALRALVTWGPRTKPKCGVRKTIKLGSYSAPERLIRIHPALDKPWVPRYFVAFVIFHEMLHQVFPQVSDRGRRALHPPEFLESERAFRHYDRAIEWEKKNLARLLRA